jgi:hypothetical protein
MFSCIGCQNVRAIEPVPLASNVASAPIASSTSPDPVPVCPVESDPGARLAPAPAAAPADAPTTLVNDVIIEKHDILPPLPPSTPESEADAELDTEDIIGNDTRMPVNRVASLFDDSIYSQQFTVHKVPCSDMTIRTYEGDDHTYVTIDTDKPVTLPIATLREVLNSIQPDPEKKRMGDTLILVIASLFMTIMLRTRDL